MEELAGGEESCKMLTSEHRMSAAHIRSLTVAVTCTRPTQIQDNQSSSVDGVRAPEDSPLTEELLLVDDYQRRESHSCLEIQFL